MELVLLITFVSFMALTLGVPIKESGPPHLNHTKHIWPRPHRGDFKPPQRGSLHRRSERAPPPVIITKPPGTDPLHTENSNAFTIFGLDPSFFNSTISESEWNLAMPSTQDAASEEAESGSANGDDRAQQQHSNSTKVRRAKPVTPYKKDKALKNACMAAEGKVMVTPKQGKVPFWNLPPCYQKCVNEKAFDTWHHLGDIRELTVEEYCRSKQMWSDNWVFHSLQWCVGHTCKGASKPCYSENAARIWMTETCDR